MCFSEENQYPQAMAENSPSVCEVGGSTTWEKVAQDAATFKSAYLKDAQSIFSRLQHHMHKKTKHGYVPLKACRKKTCKNSATCKADFPKSKLCIKKSVVICRGLAKK